MDQVIWGLIGCGNVTEIKSGSAFYKSDHSSLLAVMCRHIESAKKYSIRHHIPHFYDDADQIIPLLVIN